ncbi:MAG: ABC transporter permease [Luteolibacter sp.]
MLSSFSLISLLGVMLGVLVLVVVMSVYAGLERNVKSRILGFTPHILLRQAGELHDWREAARRAERIPHVSKATPFISDNVILDIGRNQRPVMFAAVDASDPEQIKGIELDLKNYPESTADLGLDDRVIISSTVAEQYGIGVGQKLRLYSTRNFDGVMNAYKTTEKPPIREAYREQWERIQELFKSGWKTENGQPTLLAESYTEIYNLVDAIRLEDVRQPEVELLEKILIAMDTAPDREEGEKVFRFTPEHREEIEKTVAELNVTDAEKMDGEALKNLKQFVLPKEAEVIGVYQSSQMAATPDLFVPLPLAQDLSGLDDAVMGISLRLTDPYKAGESASYARQDFADGWEVLTWMEQYQTFFALIEQQRVMMYFALSFIVLVSAFSMMAVMFTVTIQKRREIGVMKALGAAPGQIVRVFLYQGIILGVLGAVLGVGLGRVVIHFRGPIQTFMRQLNFDPFSASFTGFNELPAYNDSAEQITIGVLSMLLCAVAAVVPAFFAARSDAAKSLRNL